MWKSIFLSCLFVHCTLSSNSNKAKVTTPGVWDSGSNSTYHIHYNIEKSRYYLHRHDALKQRSYSAYIKGVSLKSPTSLIPIGSNSSCRKFIVGFGNLVGIVYWNGKSRSTHVKINDAIKFADRFRSKKHICDRRSTSSKPEIIRYVVVIDAGSTGSRANVYAFRFKNNRFILDESVGGKTFDNSDPGLSTYVDQPVKGAKSIKNLVESVKQYIPSNLHAETILSLRGTAGLRLLMKEKPEETKKLLDVVRTELDKCGFAIANNAVDILTGSDEGIYSWFTVNYLLGNFDSNNMAVATIELGGGSTQVAFVPKDATKTPSENTFTVSVPNTLVDVFSSSYLNLGYHSLQYAVLIEQNSPINVDGLNVYESACISPTTESYDFSYMETTYKIRGASNDGSHGTNFERCKELVMNVTLDRIKPKPITLNQIDTKIFAISSFVLQANQMGLTDENDEVAVGNYASKAKEICKQAPKTEKIIDVTRCLDLIYISVLLENAYDLQSDTKIKVFDQIKNFDISWPLGFAYKVLTGDPRIKSIARIQL